MSIDKLIELNERKTDLLKEYREALKYESCALHVVEQPDRKNWFFLLDIKTQAIVRSGTPDKIRAYLELRKIQPEIVYKYELVKPIEAENTQAVQ